MKFICAKSLKNATFSSSFFSIISDSIVKARVAELVQSKCVYGDFTLNEFDDDVLSDNVQSVSLCDSDHLIVDRKVSAKNYLFIKKM